MQTHGVGCYTSQAAMKKFNRQNELLADAAERAGVAAQYVANLTYPTERLREAWTRVLWHQFHDDLTGTCIPQAYQFSWNDELSAANQFAGVLTSSTAAVATVLDTSARGIPLVVFNPLSEPREELVEADVEFAGAAPAALDVVDRTTARSWPVQVLSIAGSRAHILFPAGVPAVGYKVFHDRRLPHAGRDRAGSHGARARQRPRARDDRRQRRHHVDSVCAGRSRGAPRAHPAGDARRPVAGQTGVADSLQHDQRAGSRVSGEPADQSPRDGPVPIDRRDHPPGRRIDDRPARVARSAATTASTSRRPSTGSRRTRC